MPVQRVDSGSASGGSTRCGAEGLGGGLRREGSFRWGRWSFLRRGCTYRSVGLRLLFDAHEILVRDFPAEMLMLAVLLEMLFEEDGATGIGDECARGGQKDVAGAILHLHAAPEKSRVASHPVPSLRVAQFQGQ
jgi:hypothetical protein